MVEFQQKFIGDASELLAKLETELINFENDIHNQDIIQELFRVMHTLKGTAGMFGFNRIAEFTHHLEDIYDLIRKKTIDINTEIISITFQAVDFLKIFLHNNEKLDTKQDEIFNKLFNTIKKISENDTPQENKQIQILQEPINENSSLLCVQFKPYPNIILRGINPDSIVDELKNLGKHIFLQATDHSIILEEEETYNQYFEFYFGASVEEEAITDVFLFLDEEEYKIITINSHKSIDNLFAQSLFAQSEILNKKKQNILELIETKKISSPPKEEEAENNKPTTTTTISQASDDSIRVPAAKLDNLLNLVSDLILVNAQFENHAERIPDEKLINSVKELSKISRFFRDEILSTRLIPISVLATSMQRLVRDLCLKLGKEVEFLTEGMQTELDKNIINRIETPIMHIIRNCMDHGIELPEERIRNDKKSKGVVRFIAFYSGASVFIQVQDDGRGINTKHIFDKAVAKGIVKYTDQLSTKQIYDLIFIPGFSTAQEINELSGRGVGLDVVKNVITELHGEINIDSEVGLATSFTIKLPLTLSIVDALLVHCNDYKILIPTSNIQICKYLPANFFQNSDLQYKFNNKCVPIKRLSSIFSTKVSETKSEVLIILSIYEKLYGLLVDKIATSMQAVIKPLGQMHNQQPYFIGASQLGDGSIAYILDTNFLLKN